MINLEFSLKNSKIGTMDLRMDSSTPSTPERPVSRTSHYHLGDNCIQIFHLGRYIVGYTVGN